GGGRTRRCAPGRRPGGDLRRGRRVPGLPPDPAGLGRAGTGHTRRPHPPRPGPPRPRPGIAGPWPARRSATGEAARLGPRGWRAAVRVAGVSYTVPLPGERLPAAGGRPVRPAAVTVAAGLLAMFALLGLDEVVLGLVTVGDEIDQI